MLIKSPPQSENMIYITQVDGLKIIWDIQHDEKPIKIIPKRIGLKYSQIKELFELAFSTFITKKLPDGAYVLNLLLSKFKFVLLWNREKIIVKILWADYRIKKSADIQIDIKEIVEFYKIDNIENGTYFDTILLEETENGDFESFLMNELLEQNIINLDI